MAKYLCTCPGCKANFQLLAGEEAPEAVACPACSCEVKLDSAKKVEMEDHGCTGCSGCSGC